jgi:hypothetical protein
MQMKSSLAAINSGALLKNAMAVRLLRAQRVSTCQSLNLQPGPRAANICPGNVVLQNCRANNSKKQTPVVSKHQRESLFSPYEFSPKIQLHFRVFPNKITNHRELEISRNQSNKTR